MARARSIDGEIRTPLTDWQMALADAACDTPDAARSLRWLPAEVPGTAAAVLLNGGLATPERLATLDQAHVWYRNRLVENGPRILVLDGLATHCTVLLDGERIGESRSMFEPLRLAIDARIGSELALHFAPITTESGIPSRRQRWRPHLVAGPQLRNWRASLLGHMPGWCPSRPVVGPFRAVSLISEGPLTARDLRLRAGIENGIPTLEVVLTLAGNVAAPVLHCAGKERVMEGARGRWFARLDLPDAALWWPHTHGVPALHAVSVVVDGRRIDLGRTGFRSLALDRDHDGKGFRIRVNGVPVFCRGAIWTPVDVTTLAGGAAMAQRLDQARALNLNMLRVPGFAAYEGSEFFDHCDERGIMVWQDLMLSNFDYDTSPAALGAVLVSELDTLLDANEAAPSLAVLCGGNEMAQQGAMLSLPESIWRNPFFETELPTLVAARRPDVLTVPNSPFGGDLPFRTDEGVSHYFGVGAYRRPLDDARRANPRFASECLAFANLPQPERLARNAGGALPGSAEWRAKVVRDLKADWNFEDVRDHYLGLLYGDDPARLKADDPARYLALSSAVSGEVMAAAMAEWRRTASLCGGALVLSLADVQPGFGWGVFDCDGVPKPAAFALKRAFRPLTVLLTDEGLNGLDCHIVNDTPQARSLTLTLTSYGADGAPVIDGAQAMTIPPHTTVRRSCAEIFGVFFDVTAAYGFGPAPHVVSAARLTETASGKSIADAFHFPLGRAAAMADPGLTANLTCDGTDWYVTLRAERLAQSVHVAAPGFVTADDWFHLAPGTPRSLHLAGHGKPEVTVTALNAPGPITL
ncbi:MAG: glycoside hydrolase family 2 protein [Proteobacteria bacterium]|nr:glycoside hydrolase family 2 protein [Pseudomonadota bacterium]